MVKIITICKAILYLSQFCIYNILEPYYHKERNPHAPKLGDTTYSNNSIDKTNTNTEFEHAKVGSYFSKNKKFESLCCFDLFFPLLFAGTIA